MKTRRYLNNRLACITVTCENINDGRRNARRSLRTIANYRVRASLDAPWHDLLYCVQDENGTRRIGSALAR